MIKIFIISFMIALCTYGYGKHFQLNILKINNKFTDRFSVMIFGYFLIQLITVFLNFFLPLSIIVTSIIFILGIILFFYKNNDLKKILLIFLVISSIVTILIYKSNLNNDFSLYHGPYLSIISDNKIIFGLNNLHFRFGHISAQQYFEIIFSNYFVPEIGISISIAVIFSSFIVFSLLTILKKPNLLNQSFLFLAILYFLLRSYRFNEFGNDLMPNLICIYILYIYIYLLENFKKLNDNEIQDKILTISIFCTIIIFSKLTLVIFGLLPIILIIKKKRIIKFFKDFRIIFPIIFISLFLGKNLINTGCFLYPVSDRLCIDTKWSSKNINSHSNSNIRSLQSEAWSKAWPERNKLKYTDYNKSYIQDFNWLDSWAKKHLYVVIKNIFIFISLISFLLLLNFNRKYMRFSLLYENLKIIKIPIIITALGILFWFIKAPIYRYGFSYIIGFLCLIFSIFLLQKKNIYKVKSFNIFLILAILFFLSKNIIRIHKTDNPKIANLSYQNKNIIYNVKEFDEINIRYTKDGTCYLGLPICTNFPRSLDEIKIKKIKNYKFILLKKKL